MQTEIINELLAEEPDADAEACDDAAADDTAAEELSESVSAEMRSAAEDDDSLVDSSIPCNCNGQNEAYI